MEDASQPCLATVLAVVDRHAEEPPEARAAELSPKGLAQTLSRRELKARERGRGGGYLLPPLAGGRRGSRLTWPPKREPCWSCAPWV